MAARRNTGHIQRMARAAWAVIMHKVAFAVLPRGKIVVVWMAAGKGWRRSGLYLPTDRIPVAIFDVIKPVWV